MAPLCSFILESLRYKILVDLPIVASQTQITVSTNRSSIFATPWRITAPQSDPIKVEPRGRGRVLPVFKACLNPRRALSCCFSGSLFKLLTCLPFHLLLLAQGTMSLLLTVHHKDHNFQQLVTSFVSNKVSLLRRATEVSILKACLSLRNNLSDTLHRNWGLGE